MKIPSLPSRNARQDINRTGTAAGASEQRVGLVSFLRTFAGGDFERNDFPSRSVDICEEAINTVVSTDG